MPKLSIIIPARHEIYLKQTIDDLFAKAADEIEIIAILDGYWPHEYPKENPNLRLVHWERRGMRAAINAGVAISRGKYIMKVDAHVMFGSGYDKALTNNCEDNWVVIPRRYSLEAETTPWTIRQYRPVVDYEYLGYPWRQKNTVHGSKVGIHAWRWDERTAARANILIDENMTMQGSCWMMPRKWFDSCIGKMDEHGYGSFIGEPQEIGLKCWLGGGKCMTNKLTWYAHLWKGEPYREKFKKLFGNPYTRIGHEEFVDGNKFSIDYWVNNRWEKRQHDLSWLVERFWPVPSWPEDRSKWIP